MRKDLSELLYSKFNCSYETAYNLVGLDVRDEVQKRQMEKELGYEDILTVHPTSYNSSGDNVGDNDGGRPKGESNDQQDYDSDYNNENRVKK